MPFQCAKCGSRKVRGESPITEGSPSDAREITCVGCGEALVRPPTSATVTYDSLLVELCDEKVSDLNPDELAFLVSRPVAQVISALAKMRRFGLVFCLELDLEGYESDGPEDHWVAGGSLDVLRTRARKNRFDLLHFDLGLDIAVNTDVETVRPPRTA